MLWFERHVKAKLLAMSVNKLSSKLRLSIGSSHNNDTPLNKDHLEAPVGFTSGDIEWQWTSPVGTVSNVKIRADKTPLQQMKQPCQSISPVSNNFPRKRKLVKNEEIENKFGPSAHPELLHYVTMCEPAIETELAVNKEGLQCTKEDYCTLFDDGEDAMEDCLVQCSQYIEERLSQNPKGIVPLDATTPRRSTRVHSALQKPSAFSSSPTKAAIKQSIENNFPRVKTKVSTNTQSSSLSLPTFGQGTNNNPSYGKDHRPQTVVTRVTLKKTVQDAPATLPENTTKYEINDSFDDILVTFCEENVELLSQPTNARHCPNQKFPPNVPKHRTSSRTAGTKAPESSTASTLPVAKKVVIKSSLPVPKYERNRDKTEDDFLQPDLLKLLESVEATSQPRPTTLLCTPEEIENKRRQAKLKLQQKKIAMKSASGLVRT